MRRSLDLDPTDMRKKHPPHTQTLPILTVCHVRPIGIPWLYYNNLQQAASLTIGSSGDNFAQIPNIFVEIGSNPVNLKNEVNFLLFLNSLFYFRV